jgi:hypothetical protein
MKKLLLALVIGFATPAFAQQAVQPQNQYVPIILDGPKFDAFYNSLRKISMPPDTYDQILALLRELEAQAQKEKATADAAAAEAAKKKDQ